MVEVFKTNVSNDKAAHQVIHIIHAVYPSYKVNFDLQDCDNILRVESTADVVHTDQIIFLLRKYECFAEVLADSFP